MLLIAEACPARVFCMIPVMKDLAIDADILWMPFNFWRLRLFKHSMFILKDRQLSQMKR